MVAGIEKRLFEGDAKKGKTPKYSLNDLDNELFKYVLPLDFGFTNFIFTQVLLNHCRKKEKFGIPQWYMNCCPYIKQYISAELQVKYLL